MYFVYILQSSKVQRFYIGITKNLEKRLGEHNRGSTKSTKPYQPWRVLYFEKYESKQLASKREWYLKHPPGYLDKIKIIKQFTK